MARNIKFSVDIDFDDDEITVDEIKESIEKTTGIYLAYTSRIIEAKVTLSHISED